MSGKRLFRIGWALLRWYALICALISAVVYLMPIGGGATQLVLNLRLGLDSGDEGFLPLEQVTQGADQAVAMRILCGDWAEPRPFLVETVVSSSNLMSLLDRAPRRVADQAPIVDVVEFMGVGESRWLDEVPGRNSEARVAACLGQTLRPDAEDEWYESNGFFAAHTLQFGGESRTVVFRGRRHYREEWAWWSRPAEAVLLVPATYFDVLTAVVQIPIFILRETVHSILTLGDRGDNPWRKLHRPQRWPSPRILHPKGRFVTINLEAYDDIRFKDAKFVATKAAYQDYLAKTTHETHAKEARARIDEFQAKEDGEDFSKAQYSHSELKRFVETRPTSPLAGQARRSLAESQGNVAVALPEVSESADAAGATNATTMRQRAFAVGVNVRADVESALGAGVAVEGADGPAGLREYWWDAAWVRGKGIPVALMPPYTDLPERPLVLRFDDAGVLREIVGE